MDSLLKYTRIQYGLKLQEISESTGIDMALLSKYESGGRIPPEKSLPLLSISYKIPLEVLKLEFAIAKIVLELKAFSNPKSVLQKAMERVEEMKLENSGLNSLDNKEFIKKTAKLEPKLKKWLQLAAKKATKAEEIRNRLVIEYVIEAAYWLKINSPKEKLIEFLTDGSVDGSLITPQMGNIVVKISNNKTQESKNNAQLPSWGAAYWQYFENLDKISSAETPLKLQKKYFIERNSAKGPVLSPVEDGTELKVGDKLKVRIELRVDRTMEYVHMKDMRASCMEPVNVLSSYKWQDGLGYYESTKDASTNFFFNRLPKGTYVFEYPVFITHAGNYSAGITTIQCMYAPEFTGHSEGVRVKVKE